MGENCLFCGKKMEDPRLTHCSDECLFTEKKMASLGMETPVKKWVNVIFEV